MMSTVATGLDATQLLLSALRQGQSAEAWVFERDRLNANWDDLVVRAIVYGLAPQFYDRLRQLGIAPPPRAAAKLALIYQTSGKRNQDIYGQLGQALAALNAEQIRPIGLKGIHLAAQHYLDPALRPMNDIDLLFEPDQLARAGQILAGLGYVGKHKSADLGPGVRKHTSTYLRSGGAGDVSTQAPTPNPYLSPGADRMIEPHGSLEESWFGLRVNVTDGVFERAIQTELGGQPCRVLGLDDLLLHLCVHFCFHLIMGAPSMVQLTDLLVVCQGPLELSIWRTFARRAVAARAAPYGLAALMLAERLLNAPAPPEILAELAAATPPALRERIQRLGLRDILRRTQQKPLTTVLQRVLRGLADRAETASWAPDLAGRWRVWQTALRVSSTDTGRMLLGPQRGQSD